MAISILIVALGWPLIRVSAVAGIPQGSSTATATITATASPTPSPTPSPSPAATIFTFAPLPTLTPKPTSAIKVDIFNPTRVVESEPDSPIALIAPAYCVPPDASIQEGKVVDLFDINLLLVEIDGEIKSVQLAGTKRIDPDSEGEAHFYAQVAARSLINETVLLVSIPEIETDTALMNRFVFVNGHFVNYEMIQRGLVEADFSSVHPCTGFFMVAEKYALRHRVGIWASVPIPERDWPIIAPLFTEEVQAWGEEIETWSMEWDMDPNLIATIIQIETCGNPNISSKAGAQGLFQVMPIHFAEEEDMVDVETNALRGLTHLSLSYKRYNGDIRKTLAGYNAGWTRADKVEEEWPWETGYYVNYGEQIYLDAVLDAAESEALEGWMAAGGVSLCELAHIALGLPKK